jgi:hypothetical protein
VRIGVAAVWRLDKDGRRTLMCTATPEVADRWWAVWSAAGHSIEVTAENHFDSLSDVPDLRAIRSPEGA